MVVFALAIQRFPLTRYTFTHGAAKDDNAGYVTTENERLWILNLNLNRFYLLFVYFITYPARSWIPVCTAVPSP